MAALTVSRIQADLQQVAVARSTVSDPQELASAIRLLDVDLAAYNGVPLQKIAPSVDAFTNDIAQLPTVVASKNKKMVRQDVKEMSANSAGIFRTLAVPKTNLTKLSRDLKQLSTALDANAQAMERNNVAAQRKASNAGVRALTQVTIDVLGRGPVLVAPTIPRGGAGATVSASETANARLFSSDIPLQNTLRATLFTNLASERQGTVARSTTDAQIKTFGQVLEQVAGDLDVALNLPLGIVAQQSDTLTNAQSVLLQQLEDPTRDGELTTNGTAVLNAFTSFVTALTTPATDVTKLNQDVQSFLNDHYRLAVDIISGTDTTADAALVAQDFQAVCHDLVPTKI